MTKPKFIKIEHPQECYRCLGTGFDISKYKTRKAALKHKCPTCNGSGKWIEDNYHLIVETLSGQKIAFQVDGLK